MAARRWSGWVSTPAQCTAGEIRTLAQIETALASCVTATNGRRCGMSGSHSASLPVSRPALASLMSTTGPQEWMSRNIAKAGPDQIASTGA